MKIMIFLFAGLIAIAWNQHAKTYPTSREKFNDSAEKAAILNTIENEIDCFYKRDYESWKENFVQEEYTFLGGNNPNGTFDATISWPEVDKKSGSYIKENPVEPGKGSPPWIERKNMIIKFFSESLAYIIWDQYNGDETNRTFLLSKEQRMMVKINRKWKIANVSTYRDYKNIFPVDSIYNF
jgi:hypothetical protein